MSLNTVMIVDDSEADQYISSAIIENFDSSINILQAYDGEEALNILKNLSNQPDVIFLDINMPRMNGHEFLEEYNSWDTQSFIIAMLTSSEQERDKSRAMSYKCVKKYLTKPLTPAFLEEITGIAENEDA